MDNGSYIIGTSFKKPEVSLEGNFYFLYLCPFMDNLLRWQYNILGNSSVSIVILISNTPPIICFLKIRSLTY